MIGPLRSIPARLKVLMDLLNSTWAAKLDTLATRLSATWAAKVDTLAADYTTAKAAYLDAAMTTRAAENTPVLDVPSAAVLGDNVATLQSGVVNGGFTANNTTSATFVDVVNYTGQGVVELVFFTNGGTASNTTTHEVIIDGITYSSKVLTSATSPAQTSASPIGGTGVTLDNAGSSHAFPIPCGSVPFKTSLQIRHKSSSVNTTAYTYYRFRKTA